jgi:hypothetical protein
MRALKGQILLMAWERCSRQSDPARALTLLQAAEPEWQPETLAELPLAERNRMLLELRAITFGRTIECFAVCAHCGAQLEFALDAEGMAAQMRSAEPQSWMERDRELSMRPANTGDLLACASAEDEDEARRILLSRTTVCNGHDEMELAMESSFTRSAEADTDKLARFDAINASAEIQLALQCAACGQSSNLDLDIARFLDRETTIAARRLLTDIHRLATAYGWSEHSIAEMSSSRRAAYLSLLNR